MNAKSTPGKRITELCKTYNVSLEDLAERSGLPIELILGIQKGDHIPDLAPLLKIARAFGVRLGTLLDDHENLGPAIIRGKAIGGAARFVTGLPEGHSDPAGESSGLTFFALAAEKSGRHMEPFIVDIEADSEQKKNPHEGEEFLYIISGNLALEYGTQSEILNPGDSIYYDSIVPHRVFSADGKPVRILAVIYTPV